MNMRKLFWSCALAAVAGAAGVYAAASHACHEPNSTVGQFVIGVYRGVLQSNPVFAMAQTYSGDGCARCADQPAAPCCAAVELRVGTTPTDEPVDLGAYRLPGRIVIEDEPYTTVGALVELIPSPRLDDPLGGAEESEEPERILPPTVDTAPDVMPHADGEVRRVDEPFPPARAPIAAPSAPAQEEQSEAPDYGRPPDCREDPHHYQQYPGCPHTGCPHQQMYCPYSGKPMGVAPQSRVETPKPEQLSARPRHLPEGFEESEPGRKRARRVDTMEFRPSDAKPSEFGLMPF